MVLSIPQEISFPKTCRLSYGSAAALHSCSTTSPCWILTAASWEGAIPSLWTASWASLSNGLPHCCPNTLSNQRGYNVYSQQARQTDAIHCINTWVITQRLRSPLSIMGKAGARIFVLPGHPFLSKIQKTTLAKVHISGYMTNVQLPLLQSRALVTMYITFCIQSCWRN